MHTHVALELSQLHVGERRKVSYNIPLSFHLYLVSLGSVEAKSIIVARDEKKKSRREGGRTQITELKVLQ